jgi:chromosome partitioning protein
MLLVVGGIKGGSGKTTLATNLAVCRAKQDKKVLLIDADEQKSSTDWDRQRKVHLLHLTVQSNTSKNLHKYIQGDTVSHYDDIIVDTGGRDTTTQRAALVSCDVFLMPLKPRSLDMWTLNDMDKLIKDIRQVNPKFRALAVLNQSDPRGKDAELARDIISTYSMQCAVVEIGNRKSFPNASSEGLGVIEFFPEDKKSIREILTLHDDIYTGNMLHTFKTDGKDI